MSDLDQIIARRRSIEKAHDASTVWADVYLDDTATLFERISYLEFRLERACDAAEHLLAMVPRDVWRSMGGDDGQGHYEGDYFAERLAREIRSWKETP